MPSRFEELQTILVNRLLAQSSLAGCTILAERGPTLDNKLDEKLATKTGLTILVRFTLPTLANVISNPPSFGTVSQKVRIIENILTNPTSLTAYSAAELVYKALAGTPSQATWMTDPLRPRAEYPWSTQAGSATTNIVELSFETAISL